MPERVEKEYREIERYHSLLSRYFPARSEREDAIQEGFRRALAHPERFDPARAFRPWVYVVMLNAGRDARKKRAARAVSYDYINDGGEDDRPMVEHLRGPDPDPADELEGYAMNEERMKALNSLPDSYRRILLCFAADPWVKYAGLSERLGLPAGTVRSRLSRARALLQERLRD